jgi:two-component system, NtrC family, sensor kinase
MPPQQRLLVSLRGRLAMATAVLVALTVAGASWLALRTARQVITQEVRELAKQTAERAAREIALLPEPLSSEAVVTTLRKVEGSTPEAEAIALVRPRPDGRADTFASAEPPDQAEIDLAIGAVADSAVVMQENRQAIRVAAPVRHAGAPIGAVVVHADLESLIALQQRAFRSIIGFAVLAVIVLVFLMDLLARPLIYQPIQALRQTMKRVGAGDFAARAPIARYDELGEVSEGFNDMLKTMEHFNEALHRRVREATVELEARNTQLVESYQRVFRLREQLAGAEQLAAVGQTAANVAHQVGTPLNLISGYVQLLKEEMGDKSPLAPRLAIIEEQVTKVTATVRTLLDRSRRMGPRVRTTARDLLQRVCDAIRPNLDAANIRLNVSLSPGPTEVIVDTTSLELALLNLMTNAIDAMPNGGSLAVRVMPLPPDRVIVEITDSGHGSPPELLVRIFEPWVTTKKPGRGTGLGLAITRDVVTANGGTISVTSQVGRGTTFTIELPGAADAARPSEVRAS